MGVATVVSTLAFVVNFLFMIVVVQSAGGLLASCNLVNFLFAGISVEQCNQLGAEFLGASPDEAHRGYLTALLIVPRVEAALFAGMGMGSVYAMLLLQKGTKEVAVIHFMHAVWACLVCACHAQNAGMLTAYGFPPEPNLLEGAVLVPFVAVTGVMGILYWTAFLLSVVNSVPPAAAKTGKNSGKKKQ